MSHAATEIPSHNSHSSPSPLFPIPCTRKFDNEVLRHFIQISSSSTDAAFAARKELARCGWSKTMVYGTTYYSSPTDSVKRTLLQACSVEIAKEYRQDPVKEDNKEERLIIESDSVLEAKVEELCAKEEEESLKEQHSILEEPVKEEEDLPQICRLCKGSYYTRGIKFLILY
ncbi:hypothetical protein P8452_05220 [Trifolium repens]|nr:hypothetical protein P8452_05220 [Trifolium repens]